MLPNIQSKPDSDTLDTLNTAVLKQKLCCCGLLCTFSVSQRTKSHYRWCLLDLAVYFVYRRKDAAVQPDALEAPVAGFSEAGFDPPVSRTAARKMRPGWWPIAHQIS